MKTYHCILNILGEMAQIWRFESSAMSKDFFAVKPLKHMGLSDMEELIHMKIHELGTKGYFKSLAE